MALSTDSDARLLEAMLANDEDLFTLQRVTCASTTQDGDVLLVDQFNPDPQRPTMCGLPAVRACPASRIWNRPCRACVAVAIRAGFTVVRGRNAMVNLQRIPLADS